MPSALVASNGLIGPPLWLNHKWGFVYSDPDGSFASAEVDVYLNRVNGAGSRVTLTEASSGVTRADTSVTVIQSPTWVAANLTAGEWEVHMLIDKAQVVWWRFSVIIPPGGAFTP